MGSCLCTFTVDEFCVNTEQLRQSVKSLWLTYYRDNRSWLTRLGVWVDCGGQRRPSSGFILGVLSTLEPQLTHLLPLIVDLSNNPDRIVMALGLNFNPDEELKLLGDADDDPNSPRYLPAANELNLPLADRPSRLYAKVDESCWGADGERE